jgi:ureidoglycolate amidohydrolase
LGQACEKHGFSFLTMTSRAYHDSLFMARIAPVAMLFIPCRNGYSHRPDEYASPEDIARGAQILAETLATLAQ